MEAQVGVDLAGGCQAGADGQGRVLGLDGCYLWRGRGGWGVRRTLLKNGLEGGK